LPVVVKYVCRNTIVSCLFQIAFQFRPNCIQYAIQNASIASGTIENAWALCNAQCIPASSRSSTSCVWLDVCVYCHTCKESAKQLLDCNEEINV
jgi:hypothetical protein